MIKIRAIKRVLAGVLVTILVFGVFTIPTEAQFSDLEGHWGKRAAERWYEEGVMSGMGDGSFAPDAYLTRGQLAVILERMLKLSQMTQNTFSDLPVGRYDANALLKCAAAGYIKGNGTSIRPDAPVSREESMTVLGRVFGINEDGTCNQSFRDENKVSSWAKGYVNAMVNHGYVNGVGAGLLDPKGAVTRAAFATMLDRAVTLYLKTRGTYALSRKKVVIAAGGGITLRGNAEILVVAAGAGQGEIVLENSNIEKVILEAENCRLTITKSIIKEINVAKSGNIIALQDGATVDKAIISDNAITQINMDQTAFIENKSELLVKNNVTIKQEEDDSMPELPEELTGAENDRAYRKKFSDNEAMAQWMKENIEDTNIPPMTFTVGGVSSRNLKWEKKVGQKHTFTDYPNDDPKERTVYTIIYTAQNEGLQISMDVTGYPEYPVVEFEAYLKNIRSYNSGEIKDVMSVSAALLPQTGKFDLHYSTGAAYLQKGAAEFVPGEISMAANQNSRKSFYVTNGKSTSTWLPNFNVENAAEEKGVIAVMSWQGNWLANMEVKKEGGFYLYAGQYETDFVLQPGEEYRSPLMVLLFYKGEAQNGQNLWRRWFYEHNIMRAQGIRMERNALMCVDPSTGHANAADDLKALEILKDSDLLQHLDMFGQDAGWYEYNRGAFDWTKTGNWYADPLRYPKGLREVTDAVHKLGLKYSLWLEPERVHQGTKLFNDLPGMILAVDELNFMPTEYIPDNSKANLILYDDIPEGRECIIDYSQPAAVNYVINMIDTLFTKEGVDHFRQDFNIYPAPFWAAKDRYMTNIMGIPRTGLTEEKYCTGYLRMWRELVERRPGMMIDACASGSMRADLATMRYSYIHTRTDWYQNTEYTQNQTYGYSQWYMLGGTGFVGFSNYEIRSRLTTGIGVGIAAGGGNDMSYLVKALNTWERQSQFMLEDYYPLTEYNADITALQFNNPETGKGMAVAFFRNKGEFTFSLQGLLPDAQYKWWHDGVPAVTYSATGRELMEQGIKRIAGANEALMIVYERQ